MSKDSAKNPEKHSKQQNSFEDSYKELETIVERMERGEQSLEDSLKDFEQGVSLMKLCHERLKAAEQKVEMLVKNNEGLFNTEPFEDKA